MPFAFIETSYSFVFVHAHLFGLNPAERSEQAICIQSRDYRYRINSLHSLYLFCALLHHEVMKDNRNKKITYIIQ